MKPRPDGFLAEDKIDPRSEAFDYIIELHEYLWRVVRLVWPGASGHLGEYLDRVLKDLEDAIARQPVRLESSEAVKVLKAEYWRLWREGRECHAAMPELEDLERAIKYLGGTL